MKFGIRFKHMFKVSQLVITAGLLLSSLSVNALTLQDAIKDMLANNPDVQAARQEMLAREFEITGAKSGYFPTLNAELGIGREWTRSPSTRDTSVTLTREEAALRLRQTIYDGSATSNEVDRQKARYKSALYTAIDTQENAALRASQAYINVLRQGELLSLLKESLDEHQQIFDQTSLRTERGVGSKADVEQITVRLSLATSNFIAGKNNFLDALSQFQGQIGYIPDASQMEAPASLVLPTSLDESLTIAFDKHPTMKSAAADIEAAEAQYAASKSKRHPKLTLEGDRTWNEDVDGVPADNEDWVIALRLKYNLYNGGKDSARRQQTAELVTQAKDVMRGARWETEEGMRLSWYSYEATQQQMGHLDVHVKSVELVKKAYSQQFDIGRRSLLDLLDTESELVSAKQTYTNTKYDQMYSQIRVLNSSGQLTEALGL
ncbi:MAG: adhesin transport system outer membrane protein [Candidatus Endobugula sp.]|jgi:adhesin transport system outer membrane protein